MAGLTASSPAGAEVERDRSEPVGIAPWRPAAKAQPSSSSGSAQVEPQVEPARGSLSTRARLLSLRESPMCKMSACMSFCPASF